MEKFKLTKNEKNWILYDVGNSAFNLLIATIIPIYFNYLAGNAGLSNAEYMAYWGYVASIATVIVAFLGPILGTIADTKDYKKPVFLGSLVIGSLACSCLGLARQWLVFLIIYVIAKIGFSASLIFYDSMLTDVTTEERMDNVSSQGFAWGYIGSCIPFVVSLAIVLCADRIGISMETAMAIAFVICGVWWIALSIPLLRSYRQTHFVEKQTHAIRDAFLRLKNTFVSLAKDRKIFLFLLAYFFYIDGVFTIIDMATAYGEALGLDSTGLLLALLVTQIVAFPCAILFGRLAARMRSERLIVICIASYFLISVYAIFLRTQVQFWILAVAVGMFQGGIQALSRSYYAKIIPSEKSGEYFGILDICGKGASFLGTTAVGLVSHATGDVSRGVGIISLFFLVGLALFIAAARQKKTER